MKNILLVFLLLSNLIYAKEISQTKIVTSYLYNFAKYTHWPKDSKKKYFEIFLLSKDKSLFLYVQKALQSKRLHNKEIKISIGSIREVPDTVSMLYIDKEFAKLYKTAYTYFEQEDVLIVSNDYENKRLVMINLYETKAKTLAFEVNKANISNQGLKIDPQLILLGGTELDVATLYKEVQQSLLAKEEEFQAQLHKVENLSKEIRASKQMNISLSKSIDEKNVKLQKTDTEIKKLDSLRRDLEASLKKIKEKSNKAEKAYKHLLKKQEEVLQTDKELRKKHKEELLKTNLKLAVKVKEIQEKEAELVVLDEQMRQKENALTSAGVQIQDQTKTIDIQKDILFLLLLATALFLTLVLVILRTLRLKNETNIKLQTTQKALEIQVRQTQEANASKTKFLAHMSHELRTPLNAVLGYSQILQKDQSLSDKHQKTLSTINKSGEHLLSLINDVLEVSKIETGHVELDLIAFDLYDFLDDIVNMFRPRVIEEGLDFDLVKANKLPQFIYADIGKIRQIFINLLGNAVKFTSVGGIYLNVSHKKHKLLVQIQDSGMGIDEEEVENLFKPFEQTLSGKLGGGGAGLGLSIVLEYIELMQGDIKVKSEPGIGTSFYLTIPFKLSNSSELNIIEHKEVISLKENDTDCKLLIVDDNEVNLDLLEEVLTRVGYTLDKANCGPEALALFKKNRYEAVLLDINMPEMNGYEVLQEIKSLQEGKSIPFIAITASTFGISPKTVLEKGFDGLVLKPFKDYELYETLSNLLGVKYNYKENDTKDEINDISLQEVDKELIALLLEEVKKMKIASVKDILSKIEIKHPTEAKYMQDLADEFKYDELQSFIEIS